MIPESAALVRFRDELHAAIGRDVARTRRRNRHVRGLSLVGGALVAALVLVLAQPFGRSPSAIARARAALDLPTTGLLHVTSRDAGGTVVEEVWQSLGNPSEYRRLEADPQDASGPHESAVSAGVWMRYDAQANTIYTQRVIEAKGAFSETVNLLDVRRSLALPGSRDLGEVVRDGRREHAIALPAEEGSACTYYVEEASYLPVQLDCSLNGRTTTTDYAFLPDTATSRTHLSLSDAHPDAEVKPDPNGIPGKAGDDLAAVTATGVIDITAGKPLLSQTTDDAMRSARTLELSLNSDFEECFAAHGAYRVPIAEGFTVHDPTGTVGAICQHFGDSANAVRATPAGQALTARELAQAKAINSCIEQRAPSPAQRPAALTACQAQNPDAFLSSLPTMH
jgi:hypothetical protein